MKNIVHFGFFLIVSIMIFLATFWVLRFKSSNTAVLDLIEQSDAKIEHAYTMRDAASLRQNSLLSMYVIEDAFELDDEISKFFEHGNLFRKARVALFSMPMSKEEKAIHDEIDTQTNIAQPLTNQVVKLFSDREPKENIIKVINEVRAAQARLFAKLDKFVKLQKENDKAAVEYSYKLFDDSLYWIVFIGIIAFILTFIITRYVANYVANTNAKLLSFSNDMTKAYSRAEEATALKSEFLATMSHEIRTPLTAIIGFAETTLYGDQTKEQRLNSIQTIIRSGKHLLQIINDILDLSKVEANLLEIEHVETSLIELLEDVESLEKPAADEKLIDFSINYIYPIPDKIKADQLRIKQILLNLCNNAIKFTKSGHVTVNVSCTDDDRMLFQVSDSGVGIPKEFQKIIFQPYRQADSSTTRKFGGTGLGLSLSKSLAERMGGTLSVTSEEGKGSEFKLYLPSVALPNTQKLTGEEMKITEDAKAIQAIKAGTERLAGHILLAEDNVDNQDLFSIFLERIGVNVTIVGNGKLAVEAVNKTDFDLILMDMRMPVMGGIQAVKLIREQGYKKPIIAVTANAMLEDKQDCFDAGCDYFLTKPIDSLQLNQALGKYLDIRELKYSASIPMISSLLADDPSMLKLVKRFVDSYPKTIENVEEYIKTVNYSALSEILHKLKGTSGNFGFMEVSALAEQMEFQATNENQTELGKLLVKLKQSHQQILEGLEKSN